MSGNIFMDKLDICLSYPIYLSVPNDLNNFYLHLLLLFILHQLLGESLKIH